MIESENPREEVALDADLVRKLLAVEFPEWAHLPLRAVTSAGTDHALFRLGADLVVRLPRFERAAEVAAKEFRWLPRLAPRLPVAVPVTPGTGPSRPGWPGSVPSDIRSGT